MNRRDRRNAILNFTGESRWGFKSSFVATSTVLIVLLLDHGASKQMIGAIDAVGMCLALLPQMLGVYIFHSKRNRKVRLVLWHIFAMQPFLIIIGLLTFCADRMGNTAFCWGIQICYGFMSFSVGIVVASWMSFLAGIFRKEIRGTVIGMTYFGSSICSTAGTILAGWLIKKYPGPETFAWFYILAGLGGIVVINIWLLIDESADESEIMPLPDISQFFRRFRHSLSDRNFCNFLIGRILASSGFCVISFFTVYFRSDAGGALSKSFVIQAMAAMTIGTALTSPFAGRLGDKKGHRIAIILGTLGQVLTFIIILLFPGKAGCIIAFAVAGSCMSCSFVSHYNLMLETCPHECHTTHISVANLVLGLPLGVAPLGAGFIAQSFGVRTLFVICLILSFAAFIWIWLKVKDPRTLDPHHQT